MGFSKSLLCVALAASLASTLSAPAQTGRMMVELNKLEDGDDGACRSFFLFRNASGLTLEEFEVSLAVISKDGIIDRLLTIEAAPLPADRTTLRLFDIPETACDRIGELILHDIPVCKPQNEEPVDCYSFIDLESRADALLTR